MNWKAFVKKLIRGGIYPIAACLLKMLKMNITESLANKCLEELHDFSPDKGGSCLDEKKIGEEEYDLDIIVPAYNVEKYVQKCVESILNQKTRYTYRVLLIDDGSSDNTGSIIDEFKNNRQINIIHQENKGLAIARNVGLHMLSSRYVLFVDSDDYLLDGAIEALLKEAFDHDADIVEGGYDCCEAGGKVIKTYMGKSGKLAINDLSGFAWGKVIKSNFFSIVSFPENYWFEDSLMRQIVYPMCSKIYGIRQSVCVYRKYSMSITAATENRKCVDSLYVTIKLFADRKKLNILIDDYYYEYILKMAQLNGKRNLKMPKNIQKDIFCVYAQFVRREFKNYRSKNDMEYALHNGCFELYRICSIL